MARVTEPFVCTNPDCVPVCDFCQWYRFNGNSFGVYVGQGQCAHPAHPRPEDPSGGCEDYACMYRADADDEQVALHEASQRRII